MVKDFNVVLSQGQIRHLATTGKYGLGVDGENDFKSNYIIVAGKKKLIINLKKSSKTGKIFYGCNNFPKCKVVTCIYQQEIYVLNVKI